MYVTVMMLFSHGELNGFDANKFNQDVASGYSQATFMSQPITCDIGLGRRYK